MRAHLGTYPAEFYYSNLRPHKCRTHNYVSTSAENGPAMAGPAGPVPAPMLLVVMYGLSIKHIPYYILSYHTIILHTVICIIPGNAMLKALGAAHFYVLIIRKLSHR